VLAAVQPPPVNVERSVAVRVFDLGAHPAQGIDDAAHGAAEQLLVAGERAGEGLARQDARQKAHRRAGTGTVEHCSHVVARTMGDLSRRVRAQPAPMDGQGARALYLHLDPQRPDAK